MCVFSNAGQMDASFGHQVAWNNHTHQYVPESDNQFFSLYLIQTFPLFSRTFNTCLREFTD